MPQQPPKAGNDRRRLRRRLERRSGPHLANPATTSSDCRPSTKFSRAGKTWVGCGEKVAKAGLGRKDMACRTLAEGAAPHAESEQQRSKWAAA